MSQPPSTAVTSSTRWPGSIRCASQRLRGIMSSSTTTALPRVVPANDSSSSVTEQPEPIEYGSPLSVIWSACSVISLSLHSLSSCCDLLQSGWVKRSHSIGRGSGFDDVGHRRGGDRRKQHAVAEVAGGIHEPLDAARPNDGCVIG